MSNTFILITELNLDLFNISIYKNSDYTGEVVSAETINSNLLIMNSQETAIELAQLVTAFSGVSKIDIFDKSNNLIFSVGPISPDSENLL